MMHFTIPPIALEMCSRTIELWVSDLKEEAEFHAAPPSKCPMFVFAEPIINLEQGSLSFPEGLFSLDDP
jgi:hypothetical protein